LLRTPRTDPCERISRTRLLPQVVTHKRCKVRIPGDGDQRSGVIPITIPG